VRILVVDDDKVFREELANLLGDEGHAAVTSASVPKALAELEARDFDIVLTDLRMPRQGGLELLDEVRRRWPRTLVVVVTGFAAVETAVESMKRGAFDYVRKPFEIREVHRVLERAQGELRFVGETEPGVDLAALVGRWAGADHREVLHFTDRAVRPPDGVTVVHPDYENPYRIREEVDAFVDSRERVAVVLEGGDRLWAGHRREEAGPFVAGLRAKVAEKGPLVVTFDPRRLSSGDVLDLRAAVSAERTHGTLEALASPVRRAILRRVAEGPCSFGEAMEAAGLKDESPKLSFHLRKLQDDGLLVHDGDRYRITELGKESIQLLERLESTVADAVRYGGVVPQSP
jgi:ActR/RegA family two-component response regulator/DNA-binding transcriptional ArsR family regulator